ncbi:hypothetical protein [Aquimarina algiphila]|uniref:hypothetical protein n=1 Tax=Aquimarina algiphila TaxID=2047982 RepID=UPI002490FEA1|nr:hypothetical protein [Aquimarina algiphila]
MKTQNLKKLALLCVGFLIFSCSKSDISETDETLALEKSEVEIVENVKVDITQESKGSSQITGPSTVDAYESSWYQYFLTPSQQSVVPSNLRRFFVYFEVDNPNTPGISWQRIERYDLPYSGVSVRFPRRYSTTQTNWRIGFQMYDASHQSGPTAISWKRVTVHN